MKNLNNFIIDNNITLDITKKTLNENMFNDKTNIYKGKNISEIKNFTELIADDISKHLEKWIKAMYRIDVRFDAVISQTDDGVLYSFKTPLLSVTGIFSGTFSKFSVFSSESKFNIIDNTCDKYIPLYMHLNLLTRDKDAINKEFNMNGSKSDIIYYDLEDEKIYIE